MSRLPTPRKQPKGSSSLGQGPVSPRPQSPLCQVRPPQRTKAGVGRPAPAHARREARPPQQTPRTWIRSQARLMAREGPGPYANTDTRGRAWGGRRMRSRKSAQQVLVAPLVETEGPLDARRPWQARFVPAPPTFKREIRKEMGGWGPLGWSKRGPSSCRPRTGEGKGGRGATAAFISTSVLASPSLPLLPGLSGGRKGTVPMLGWGSPKEPRSCRGLAPRNQMLCARAGSKLGRDRAGCGEGS